MKKVKLALPFFMPFAVKYNSLLLFHYLIGMAE
jgi:hypothetical protein